MQYFKNVPSENMKTRYREKKCPCNGFTFLHVPFSFPVVQHLGIFAGFVIYLSGLTWLKNFTFP